MDQGITDFDRLVGSMSSCGCGRRHAVATRVILGRGVLHRLPGLLAELPGGRGEVLVVSDLTTRRVAGDAVLSMLARAGFAARAEVIPAERPHTDERTIAGVAGADPGACSCLVAVGSGTVTDVVRKVAFEAGRPFVAVATAASMDGYTSTVVPLLIDGVKQSTPAAPPAAVVADLDLIAAAPAAMTRAGLGDLIGKLTAKADWALAHCLTGEYYCPAAADLALAALAEARRDLAGLAAARPDALAALMRGLLLSGLAIQMVGNSRPASGAEHHLGHHWEERALEAGHEPNLHGAGVGVATVLVADLARLLAGLGEDEVRARLGTGPPPWPLERWGGARRALGALAPRPGEVQRSLRLAGAPATPADLGLSDEDVLDAMLHAGERRSRFTVLTLACCLGVLAEWAPGIIARYA